MGPMLSVLKTGLSKVDFRMASSRAEAGRRLLMFPGICSNLVVAMLTGVDSVMVAATLIGVGSFLLGSMRMRFSLV